MKKISDYCFCAVCETYFTKQMQENGCTVIQMYKPIPKPFKALRKLHFMAKIPGFRIWLNKAPVNITGKKVFVVYASDYSREFVKMLREKTDATIYFWYNNIIETDGIFHNNLKVRNLIPSSFDELDCQRYKMYYNTQYYFSSIQLPDVSICYDVSCVCKDKGRGAVLLKLENYLNSLGLKTYFHICKDNTSSDSSGINYKPQVSYDEILKIVAQSKVIIDITQDKQNGLTLRPLEAIFFGKKLITNNKSIEKCRFYSENNICVIDTENIQIPITFFSSPYEEISNDIITYYDFKQWLFRFDDVVPGEKNGN